MGKKKSLSKGKDKHEEKEEILPTSCLNFVVNQKYQLTSKQQDFLDLARKDDTNIIFCDGPAGSSKTYLTVLLALDLLKQRKINEIIYIRSIVESASRSLGSLPGEVGDKFKPWSIPLLEKCDELIDHHITDNLIKNEYIKCIPVNYLRGSTFKNCAVIIDESQNMSAEEITTAVTRYGKNCKMFIIGDSFQNDIKNSGFKSIFNAFNSSKSIENGIFCNKFEKEDIVRSKLLRYIVEVLEQLKSQPTVKI